MAGRKRYSVLRDPVHGDVYLTHEELSILDTPQMQRLLQERDALSVVDDEIGAPTWAGMIAQVTAEIVRKRRSGSGGPGGLYHLTASGETSWYGFACHIAQHLQSQGLLRARIEPTRSADYPTAAQRPLNSRLNCARLQRDWQITLPSWETALQQCLNDVPYAQTEHAVPAAQSV